MAQPDMTQFSNPLARWNERFSSDGYLFGEKPKKYLAGKNKGRKREKKKDK